MPTNPAPSVTTTRRLLTAAPSADLAVAAQGGDADAAAELYRRTRTRARRAARAYCRDIDADDAVAEGLFRALGRLGQLREPAAVEAWMIRCVVRSALDMSRQRPRLWATSEVDRLRERAEPPTESAAERVMSSFDRATMAAALREVPLPARQLLALRYQAGLSVADIARVLGRPEGTVRRQCVEARRVAGQRFLRHHLQPAAGVCAQVSEALCREVMGPQPDRRLARARRLTRDHLRRCRACRDRRVELTSILAELGYRDGGRRI
jgi:RNA polymerase sigma-70 factor (ECF subfamily)